MSPILCCMVYKVLKMLFMFLLNLTLFLFQVLSTFKLVHKARLLCFKNDNQMLNGMHTLLYIFYNTKLMTYYIKIIICYLLGVSVDTTIRMGGRLLSDWWFRCSIMR